MLDKAGTWDKASAADSPLLAAAILAKLPAAEAALAPQLAQVLLLQHSKRLKKGGLCGGSLGGVGWGGGMLQLLVGDRCYTPAMLSGTSPALSIHHMQYSCVQHLCT